jgi:hypothetical protein
MTAPTTFASDTFPVATKVLNAEVAHAVPVVLEAHGGRS